MQVLATIAVFAEAVHEVLANRFALVLLNKVLDQRVLVVLKISKDGVRHLVEGRRRSDGVHYSLLVVVLVQNDLFAMLAKGLLVVELKHVWLVVIFSFELLVVLIVFVGLGLLGHLRSELVDQTQLLLVKNSTQVLVQCKLSQHGSQVFDVQVGRVKVCIVALKFWLAWV